MKAPRPATRASATRRALDQGPLAQPRQGLADRKVADPEFRGQGALDESHPGR
jgi:hypothetical protein